MDLTKPIQHTTNRGGGSSSNPVPTQRARVAEEVQLVPAPKRQGAEEVQQLDAAVRPPAPPSLEDIADQPVASMHRSANSTSAQA